MDRDDWDISRVKNTSTTNNNVKLDRNYKRVIFEIDIKKYIFEIDIKNIFLKLTRHLIYGV